MSEKEKNIVSVTDSRVPQNIVTRSLTPLSETKNPSANKDVNPNPNYKPPIGNKKTD